MMFPMGILKKDALRLLRGKWNSLVLALFIPFLIYCCFAARVTMTTLGISDIHQKMMYYMYLDIGTLIFSVVLDIVTVGIYYNLDETRERASFFSVYGFAFSRIFKLLPFLMVVMILPEGISLLLAYANTDWLYDYLLFSFLSYPVYQIVILVFGYGVQIVAIYLRYSFLLVPCILAEHPDYSGTRAMKESFALSRGKRFYLFLLSLSFIGWMILGTVAIIGILWAILYLLAARYAYYKRITIPVEQTMDSSVIEWE